MKRRQFLSTTAGAAGVLLAGLARGETKPCPPPTVNVKDGATINTPCTSAGSPPSAGTPAWFTAADHKEWATPVSNWLGASGVIDPLAGTAPNVATTGHKSIIIAWTGMGADQGRRTIWMAGNGGHNDYAGNEVYACDLSAASPAWTRKRNASLAPSFDGQILTKWPDGTPPADHTGMLQVAAEGRWFKLGLGSPNWAGPPKGSQYWEFDPNSNQWIDRGNSWPADTYAITGCALYDKQDRQLIKIRATGNPAVQFISLDSMSPALSTGNDMGSSSIIIGSIDTQNRVLLWRAGDYPNFVFVLDLKNKSAGWKTIPVSGDPPQVTHAFHWHNPSGAFITWDGASGLKKLTPTISGGVYTAATWSSVSGGGGPVPVNGTTLMYNKIQLIENMGNGESALVVVPRYGSPDVYVMRLAGAV